MDTIFWDVDWWSRSQDNKEVKFSEPVFYMGFTCNIARIKYNSTKKSYK